MNPSPEELLSAYLDDELSEAEFKKLYADLQAEPHASQQLHRYALIGEAIKGQSSTVNAESISQRVSTALQNEPVVLAPKPAAKKRVSPFSRQLAAVAIAASVATVAVLNFGNFLQQDSPATAFPVTAVVPAKVQTRPFDVQSVQVVARQPATQWKTLSTQPGVEDELNQLLMDHSEYTHEAGVPGLLPYATFVVYDR